MDVEFDATLNAGEKTTLDGLVSSHVATDISGTFFMANDTSGNINIDSGFTPITWNNEIKKDSIYSHIGNSSDIMFLQSGDYLVKAEISIDQTSGSNRSNSIARLVQDSGSGFMEIIGTRSYGYHRDNINGQSTSNINFFMSSASKNTKIRVEALKSVGNGTLKTIKNGSRIIIEKK